MAPWALGGGRLGPLTVGGLLRRSPLLLCFCLTGTLPGCEPLLSAHGPKGSGDGGGEGGEGPEVLVVSPSRLDFGLRSVEEDGPLTRSFTMTNAGSAPLVVHGQDEVLSQSDGADLVFTVEAEPLFELAPDETRSIPVTFSPTGEGSWEGELRVNYGLETLDLSGSGAAPVLTVGEFSVPTTAIGCEASFELPILSEGSEPLLVTDLSPAEDTDFSILSTDISVPLQLSFHPSWSAAGGGARETMLSLLSNDPERPELTLPLSGFAYEGEMVQESFTYTPGVAVDLLVVADTEGVMAAYLDEGERATDALAADYEAAHADVHLAVITGATSCPVTRTDRLEELSSVLELGLDGPSGPGSDALLVAAASSLAGDVPGGCMDGFLRDNTQLHVVVLAGGPDGSGETIDDSLAELDTRAPQATEVVVSALIPTEVSACGGTQYGEGYAEAAIHSGGALEDLCSGDWTGFFAAMVAVTARRAAGSLSHPLAELPLPESIGVKVDGLSFSAWTWEEASNSLVFDTASAPDAGARVELEYMARVDCGD